jgi:hypothetical protein
MKIGTQVRILGPGPEGYARGGGETMAENLRKYHHMGRILQGDLHDPLRSDRGCFMVSLQSPCTKRKIVDPNDPEPYYYFERHELEEVI